MSHLSFNSYDIDEVKVFEPSLNDIFVQYAGNSHTNNQAVGVMGKGEGRQ